MLDSLRRRLAGLAAGRPSLVLAVTGPAGVAGVGKSHGLKSLLRELPCGHLTLEGRGTMEGLIRALPAASREPAWVTRGLSGSGQSPDWQGAEVVAARLACLGTVCAGGRGAASG